MSEIPIPLQRGFYAILITELGRPVVDGDALTRLGTEGPVTLLRLGDQSVQPGQQLWLVQPENGKLIITEDPNLPPIYLTYDGTEIEAPIVARPQPAAQWQVGTASEKLGSLRVAGTDLGIVINGISVPTPKLALGKEEQLSFYFKFIRPA